MADGWVTVHVRVREKTHTALKTLSAPSALSVAQVINALLEQAVSEQWEIVPPSPLKVIRARNRVRVPREMPSS